MEKDLVIDTFVEMLRAIATDPDRNSALADLKLVSRYITPDQKIIVWDRLDPQTKIELKAITA